MDEGDVSRNESSGSSGVGGWKGMGKEKVSGAGVENLEGEN